MSDDRLFVSNNPIGRVWYFINIIILIVLTFITKFVFEQYIIPNTRTDEYTLIAQIIMYFLYLVYLISFCSLIDRRLYDISGDRNSSAYKTISSLMSLIIFYEICVVVSNSFSIKLPVDLEVLNSAGFIIFLILILITTFLGFFRGKISNQTYDKYRKKPKYY